MTPKATCPGPPSCWLPGAAETSLPTGKDMLSGSCRPGSGISNGMPGFTNRPPQQPAAVRTILLNSILSVQPTRNRPFTYQICDKADCDANAYWPSGGVYG